MKKLLKGSELVLGVVHQEGDGHWLRPVEKKERRELPISDLGEAQAGDLVLAEKIGRPPRLAARVDTRPRRSVRAAQLQPDRDPQARHPARISGRACSRKRSGWRSSRSASARI